MPVTILNELKALNIIHPYIDLNERLLTFIGTTLYNSNVAKKSNLKSSEKLFPWLAKNDKFEDEIVKKAKGLINSLGFNISIGNSRVGKIEAEIKSKIAEEIELQYQSMNAGNAKAVRYRIRELKKLL